MGVNYTARCAECGVSYEGTDARALVEFQKEHMLHGLQMPCPKCGEKLSLRDQAATCPQCGSKVTWNVKKVKVTTHTKK